MRIKKTIIIMISITIMTLLSINTFAKTKKFPCGHSPSFEATAENGRNGNVAYGKTSVSNHSGCAVNVVLYLDYYYNGQGYNYNIQGIGSPNVSVDSGVLPTSQFNYSSLQMACGNPTSLSS